MAWAERVIRRLLALYGLGNRRKLRRPTFRIGTERGWINRQG